MASPAVFPEPYAVIMISEVSGAFLRAQTSKSIPLMPCMLRSVMIRW